MLVGFRFLHSLIAGVYLLNSMASQMFSGYLWAVILYLSTAWFDLTSIMSYLTLYIRHIWWANVDHPWITWYVAFPNLDKGRVAKAHDDVIKRKPFPRNWPFVRRFPAQRPVTRSFDVFFDLRWINGQVNNGKAGDLRRNRVHYDVTVMMWNLSFQDIFVWRLYLIGAKKYAHGKTPD